MNDCITTLISMQIKKNHQSKIQARTSHSFDSYFGILIFQIFLIYYSNYIKSWQLRLIILNDT